MRFATSMKNTQATARLIKWSYYEWCYKSVFI